MPAPEEINDTEAQASADAFMQSVKQFRKEIDANIVKAEAMLKGYPAELQHISCARELSLVRTKLQEAKMWAGKILEVMGSPFPADLADKSATEVR